MQQCDQFTLSRRQHGEARPSKLSSFEPQDVLVRPHLGLTPVVEQMFVGDRTLAPRDSEPAECVVPCDRGDPSRKGVRFSHLAEGLQRCEPYGLANIVVVVRRKAVTADDRVHQRRVAEVYFMLSAPITASRSDDDVLVVVRLKAGAVIIRFVGWHSKPPSEYARLHTVWLVRGGMSGSVGSMIGRRRAGYIGRRAQRRGTPRDVPTETQVPQLMGT